MVPIPEGVERYDGEPPENGPQDDVPVGEGEDHNLLRGSGGSPSDKKKRVNKGKGKESENTSMDRRPDTRERYIESTTQSSNNREAENAAFLASRRMESLTGIRPSTPSGRASRVVDTRDSDFTSVRERGRDRPRENDNQFGKEGFARWEKEVLNQLESIELEKKIEVQQRLLGESQALLAQKRSIDRPAESASGGVDAENGRRRQTNLASSSRRPD
jgi:hypothetical protein